ncbi:MAG: hypothetical protein WC788_08935 [Candidatus Paceibacterota bacterium]|jgi:hypothetical protein
MDVTDVIINPEKIMTKLVLLLALADLFTLGLSGGKYLSIGIVSTILISGIFFAVKKIYKYDDKCFPVFIASETVLAKSFILYGYAFIFYYSDAWLRTTFFLATAIVILIGVFTIISVSNVTREDFEEVERRKELDGKN